MKKLHAIANENKQDVLTLVEDFIKTAEWIRNERVIGEKLVIEATDFSYQQDREILEQIDSFMK